MSPFLGTCALEDALANPATRRQLTDGARSPVKLGDLRRAIERGDIVVLQESVRQVCMPIDEPFALPVLGPEPEVADVEFVFEYADGTPVKGLPYVFVEPGGAKENGKLAASGIVGRKEASGSYVCALKEVDLVEWQRRRVRATDEARIVARTSGIDDGTRGTLKVFRLYEEDAKAALVTIPVEVTDGRVDASWTYEPKADEEGVARFVAELSFDDGAVWKKSEPLEVELHTAVSAEWSLPFVAPGEDVDLVVRALGFGEDAEIAITLYRHCLGGEVETLGDVPSPALSRRSAQVTLRCGEGALPARMGDVFAVVTAKEAGTERTACSAYLFIGAAQAVA